MDILDYIPEGRENAISRRDLAARTGLTDRQVRLAVKALVRQGVPILSSSSCRGYWYSEDISELEGFIRESESRYRTEQVTLARLKKRLYEAKHIRAVPVCQHYRRVSSSGIIDGQERFGGI